MQVRWALTVLVLVFAAFSQAQVPDLMSAFQAGSRAMALGGATAVTDSNTYSALANPATLALIDRTEYGLALRNLPETSNVASGSLERPDFSTDSSRGRTTLSHFGYATPIKGGAFGISYTIGGYVNDQATAVTLTTGPNFATNYSRNVRAQTNYLAASLGRLGPQYSVGYGLVVASQSARYSNSFITKDGTGTTLGTTSVDFSGDQIGYGLVLGVQSLPVSQRATWGVSLRTPIKLGGNSRGNQVVSSIPGSLSIGTAQRQGVRQGSDDFWIFAAQSDFSFGGSGTDLIDRKTALGYGVGAEYNLLRDDVRVPLRVGYRYVPSTGSLFKDRSELTFGLGYRPVSNDYSVDISMAKPLSGGAVDLAVSVAYRPTKG